MTEHISQIVHEAACPVIALLGADDAEALAENADPGASSTCSVCGRAVADDDIEDTNGWRWYSDGRGGLRTLCATCPVPASLSIQNT